LEVFSLHSEKRLPRENLFFIKVHSMGSMYQYEILPISYPEDVDAILESGRRAFSQDPASVNFNANQSEETLKARNKIQRNRLLNSIEGRGYPETDYHSAKAVYKPIAGPEELVGCCAWTAPAVDLTTPRPEPYPLEYENLTEEMKRVKELRDNITKQLDAVTEKLMGKDHKEHYWYLGGLGVVPEHQRRGIGSKLVKWGIEEAKADAKARPGLIKGVWTIATPAGLKTYLNVGMKPLGSGIIDHGNGAGENGQKYVWLRKNFEDEE
jgi:GNAT superfamily N-acetyltransferase